MTKERKEVPYLLIMTHYIIIHSWRFSIIFLQPEEFPLTFFIIYIYWWQILQVYIFLKSFYLNFTL